MIPFIFLCFFVFVLIFFCDYYERYDLSLKAALILIFIFSALRYDYGPDYKGYLDAFKSFQINNHKDYYDYLEFGWLYLIVVFKNLNFFWLIVFLSFLSIYSWYLIIKKLVSPKLYWFSIVLYLLDTNNFLISLSGLRQALAVNILMLSVVYLISDSKISIKYITVFLSYLFHFSSLIASIIVISLKLLKPKKISGLSGFILVLIYSSVFFSIDKLKSVFSLTNLIFLNPKYNVYSDLEFSNPGILNTSIYITFLILLLLVYRSLDKRFQYFSCIYMVGLFFIPIGYIIPMAGRMIYYFFPFSIVIFPKIMEKNKSNIFKMSFFFFVFSILIARQYQFWTSEYLGAHYNYKTIFWH